MSPRSLAPLLFVLGLVLGAALVAAESDPKRACHGQAGKVHKNRGPDGKKTRGGFVSESSTVEKTVTVAPGAGVCEDAVVRGRVRLDDDAFVFGHAEVTEEAVVSGDARVFGDAKVSGKAHIAGNARVFGDAVVSGEARILDDAWIEGDAVITGTAVVGGKARITTGTIESGEHRGDGKKDLEAAIARLTTLLGRKKTVNILFPGDHPTRTLQKLTAFEVKGTELVFDFESTVLYYQTIEDSKSEKYYKKETEKHRATLSLPAIERISLFVESEEEPDDPSASTMRIELSPERPVRLTKRVSSLVHRPTTRRKSRPEDDTRPAVEINFAPGELAAARELRTLLDRIVVLGR